MTGIAKTTREQKDALRSEWETDPAATFVGLGARIGLRAASLSDYARSNGWARSPEVEMQASAIRGARNRDNMRKAIESGYMPDTTAAMQAKAAIFAGGPVTYKKDRRYPCWDTRQKERPYTLPQRYASVFDYAEKVAA
jgi:hypothetical protein